MSPKQTRAFARRAGLEVGPDMGAEILNVLRPFLLPVLENLRRGLPTTEIWAPGGPWRPGAAPIDRDQSDV